MQIMIRRSRWPFSVAPRARMRGQSLAEFIIVIPVLILLTLGILQFALFFMAKSTLNQATISGVRDGIVKGGDMCHIRVGIVEGLVPLYQPAGMSRNLGGYLGALANAWTKTMLTAPGDLNNIQIDVLNPTEASFKDFASTKDNVLVDGKTITAIPNARLLYRNTDPGGASGQSIQDANLLSIRVHYCYPVIVWPVKWITEHLNGPTLAATACYTNGGIDIQSTATMLMQSPTTDGILDKVSAAVCGGDPFGFLSAGGVP
jgi:hypothetical protein